MVTSANTVMDSAIETRTAAYVKLSRPRLHQPIARPRLYRLLDRLRAAHPVIWIAAPPGSGKTALAGTWVNQAAAPVLWCQLDQADADPATLFFYLAEAVRAMPGAQCWELGHQADQTIALARLFFRTFYAKLPAGSIVVFDNVQDVDWQHAGKLLEHAFSEVPEGVTVLALSRNAPPPSLARMELHHRLAVVGWDALRFDQLEACALAQLDGGPMPAWLASAEGWGAGIVMLRTRAGQDALARYFAGEILNRMTAPRQQLLLQLACLPAVSADQAWQITAERDAARLLQELYEQRLFIERCDDAGYHFQPLFAAFLQREARDRLDPAIRAALNERSAALLEGQGGLTQAAPLFHEAGEAALTAFLLRHAAALIGSGRGECWRLWMSWLNGVAVDAAPQLWYWHGVSLCAQRPLHARKILMRAEREFVRRGDVLARLLAIAAIIDSYDGEWSDPAALPHWCTLLADGLAGIDPDSLDPATDLRLHARLAGALLAVAPDAPMLVAVAERALRALYLSEDAAAILAAAELLLPYCDWLDNAARANALLTEVAKVAADPALDPARLVRWYKQVAQWYSKEGEHGQARHSTCSVQRIVSDFNLSPLLFYPLEIGHFLRIGELAEARGLLDQFRASLTDTAKRDLVECSALEGHWYALSGDLAGATRAAHDTLRLAQEAGMAPFERARFDAFLGACLACNGELAAAQAYYDSAAVAAYGVQARQLREDGHFIAAYACALGDDPEAAVPLLRSALANHRERACLTLFPMMPQLAARIAALALEHQIELDHVLAVVMRQRLAAPRRSIPRWPWAVAVRTLGGFSIELYGEPVVWSGKSQQRPLALLKSLVTAGEGGRSQHALQTQLWGEAEVAKSALSVTVHRLRKMLKSENVIFVSGGRVWFCPTKVWSDVDALADVAGVIGALPQAVARARLLRLGAALVDLYRGPFFDGSEDSWILPERERACRLFLGAVAQLGKRLEACAEWSEGLRLYQRALEAESLSEANYRGAMRCAYALEGQAAAFALYRRCRDTLSIVLGIAPSPATERLAVTLGLRHQGPN